MATHSRSRRKAYARAKPGSSRWFRPYRVLVVLAWLLVLAAGAWLLFVQPERGAGSVTPVSNRQPGTGVGVSALQPVSLPADDAPHESLTEWWYYSGQVQTESGERYSFHVATFLRGGGFTHTVFHGSLLDQQSHKHYTEQARTAGNPSQGSRDGFDFSFGSWHLKGNGAEHSAKMAGKDFAVDLQLHDLNAPVLHQAPGALVPGLLDFGAAGKSYYTSRPRMQATGTVMINGATKAVRGEVWFDHQWGEFDASLLRWNWFALQLDDGADLMGFALFDREGEPVLRMGTYVREGQVTPLGEADFKAVATGSWKSQSTGVVFPVDWTIAVPGKNMKVKLTPAIRQSLFDARLTTLNVYWEGAVAVSGSQSGIGFMELSGYDAVAEADRASDAGATSAKAPRN